MKEWNELYRDFLSAYNVMGEAIATAKTLHERDSRRIAELEAELAAERDELLARAEAAEEDGAAYELRRLAGLAGLPVSADSAHEVTEELAAAVARVSPPGREPARMDDDEV